MAARAPMAGANVRCFIKAPPTKNCRADGHKSASVIHFTPLIVMSSLQLSLGAREGILPAKKRRRGCYGLTSKSRKCDAMQRGRLVRSRERRRKRPDRPQKYVQQFTAGQLLGSLLTAN